MELEQKSCKISRWQLLKGQLNNLRPADFVSAFKQSDDAILIDVRTPKEFEDEHLEGAINVDYLGCDFWEHLEQLDPDATYFVYCRTERRSIRACTLMKNGGFKNVFNMEGGITAWKAAVK